VREAGSKVSWPCSSADAHERVTGRCAVCAVVAAAGKWIREMAHSTRSPTKQQSAASCARSCSSPRTRVLSPIRFLFQFKKEKRKTKNDFMKCFGQTKRVCNLS
jgi:hypothetical protein